jgi:hypothetical protein
MASNVIVALCQGELSDPPGISWCTPLLMTDGKPKMDKDGLHLWRCFRGTGCTEGAHGQFTRAFGHKRAGPVLCVCVNKPPFPSKLACIPATSAQFPKDPP